MINLPVVEGRSCDGCTKCCEGYLAGEIQGKQMGFGKPCFLVEIGKGCNDYENRPVLGGGAAPTLWHLYERRDIPEIKKLLEKTKYVVLEIGYMRWWDENLHGKIGGEYLPNTPIEIENYIKLKDSDSKVVEEAIRWIANYDESNFWKIGRAHV